MNEFISIPKWRHLSLEEYNCNAKSMSDEINRVALITYYFNRQPLDALTLHFDAIKSITLPLAKEVIQAAGQIEDDILKQRNTQIASDVVVTLMDMHNCLISTNKLEDAKTVLLCADSIYHLMSLESSLIAYTINHRLIILQNKLSIAIDRRTIITYEDFESLDLSDSESARSLKAMIHILESSMQKIASDDDVDRQKLKRQRIADTSAIVN